MTTPALAWGLPFLGVLASIALLPMLAPRFWHRRMGLIATAWVLSLLVPQTLLLGVGATAHAAWHAVLIEFLPFVSLLGALYVVAGGILLRGGPWGTPAGNTGLLALGTVLAGIMGTTGAAMVLIHPLLRANAHRSRKTHLVIFFILLVANAGDATTPLGDPPLYVGFLRGVPFGWPLLNLGLPLLLLALPLLVGFWLLDRHWAKSEPAPPAQKLHLRGGANIALLGVIVACVVAQGIWRPGDISLAGQPIGAERLLSMAIFTAIIALSLAITPRAVHQGNLFSWAPITEVAILFAAIFITITPVMTMLHAGLAGPLAPLLRLTMTTSTGELHPLTTFWLAGVLSAFLDNAPTYLVFFELAGGDAATLTTRLNPSLTALSAGAVFFGALTYIGNAPNMMVQSIAAHRGIRMPGFFGYFLIAGALLLPGFLLLSLVFFR